MFIADPEVPGDTEQVETHVKRDPAGDGGKGALAVGKMTGVLPEKVSDKRFSQCFVASVLHKKMLQFTCHTSQVEGPVRQFHTFEVDDDYPEPVAEQYIGGCDIAMDNNLLVLPHTALFSVPILEPVKLQGFIRSYVAPGFQLFHEFVKVRTSLVELYPETVGRALVQGGQKIGEGSEFLKEGLSGPFPYRFDNEIMERRPVAKFNHQKAVQVGIAT